MRERPRAPKRAVNNIRNWFEEFKGAIDDPEAQFIEHDGDLIAFVRREKTLLVRLLEKFSWIRQSPCFRIRKVSAPIPPQRLTESLTFTKPQQHHFSEHYESERTVYYSATAMHVLSTLVVLVLGLGMLLGPAWWLANAATLIMRLTIISIFVPLFMALLILLAPLRPFEILAATAA